MGVHLTISTMETAYSVGDVALILPSDTVEAGSDYMLRRRGSNPGTYRLVRVDRVTATYILPGSSTRQWSGACRASYGTQPTR